MAWKAIYTGVVVDTMISVMVEKTSVDLPKPLDLLSSEDQHVLELTAGARLFSQGDATRGMYFLCEGRVNLIRHTEDGHQILIHRANAGTTCDGGLLVENE